MTLRFDLLFRFLEMKKDLEEEQRKSAMSRIQSQALRIVLDKRRHRINQLGVLSSKICETIKREREEKRKLQLQYCPETLEAEGEDPDEWSNVRAKLFEDDEEQGGVKLYIQNTEYKQIVLNIKDLTDICEVTTDSEAENELTSLDSEDPKKKKKKNKKPSKLQSKQELTVPPAMSQPSKRKKKKKHNDSLSDDDHLAVAPAPELQHITLTVADIDTLTEDFDAAHTLKLKQALEDLMRAQGVFCGDSSSREGAHGAGDVSTATDVADDSIDDGSGGVTVTNLSEVSLGPPSSFGFFSDDDREASNVSSANSNPSTTVRFETEVEPTKKKKSEKKKNLVTSFDVNDVD